MEQYMEENKTVNTELEELKKNINTLKGKITTLDNKRKELEKDAKELIAKTIYQKKQEIEKSYDEVIKEAEVRLKSVEKEKVEEKKRNLNIIIDHTTKSFRENNVYLANEIKRILKDNELPGFVNSEFYMTLWNPTNILDVMLNILAAIIVFAIPSVLSFVTFKDALIKAFPNTIIRFIIIALIYLAVIFVFALIWLTIDKLTKKNSNALKEIIELRKNISDNKKEIAKIAKNTTEETTDDKFDYTKLDREIEAGKLEVENYKAKKKEVLDNFVNVTEEEITKKIEFEASKGIGVIDTEIENVKKELSSLQEKHDAIKLNEATS